MKETKDEQVNFKIWGISFSTTNPSLMSVLILVLFMTFLVVLVVFLKDVSVYSDFVDKVITSPP